MESDAFKKIIKDLLKIVTVKLLRHVDLWRTTWGKKKKKKKINCVSYIYANI